MHILHLILLKYEHNSTGITKSGLRLKIANKSRVKTTPRMGYQDLLIGRDIFWLISP
jgi:hypothetical protein